MIGNLTHVFIDATSHEFNPLLYPISSNSVDILRISNNLIFDNIVINGFNWSFLGEYRQYTKRWNKGVLEKNAGIPNFASVNPFFFP